MSQEAREWAFMQPVRSSAMKFVLVVLGDRADKETGLAWCSTPSIAERTGQDRKTVISCLDKLEADGFITDTGERAGSTGQVKVYRINFDKAPKNGTVNASITDDSNSTENGSLSEIKGSHISHESLPNFPSKAPIFPAKAPKNGRQNSNEQILNRKGTDKAEPSYSPIADLMKRGVSKQVADDWLKHRAKIKAAVTETVVNGIDREAVKAGVPLGEALEICCIRGWRGFDATWMRNARASPAPQQLGRAGQATALAAQKFLEDMANER